MGPRDEEGGPRGSPSLAGSHQAGGSSALGTLLWSVSPNRRDDVSLTGRFMEATSPRGLQVRTPKRGGSRLVPSRGPRRGALLGSGRVTPTSASVFTWPPHASLCCVSASLSSREGPVARAGPTPVHEALTLVPSAETLLPDEVPFTGSSGHEFWGHDSTSASTEAPFSPTPRGLSGA